MAMVCRNPQQAFLQSVNSYTYISRDSCTLYAPCGSCAIIAIPLYKS